MEQEYPLLAWTMPIPELDLPGELSISDMAGTHGLATHPGAPTP